MRYISATFRVLTVIAGILSVIVPFVSFFQRLIGADAGAMPFLIVAYRDFFGFFESAILSGLNTIIPSQRFELPDGYVEAFVPSAILTVGYVRSIDVLAGDGKLPENKYRKFIRAPFIVLFSISLLGLSLIISLLQNSLNSEEDAEVAFQTMLQTALVMFASILFYVSSEYR